MQFTIRTAGNTNYINITDRVEAAVRESNVKDGIAHVFVRHTTVGLVVTEDEEGFKRDLKAILERLIPRCRSPSRTASCNWERGRACC